MTEHDPVKISLLVPPDVVEVLRKRAEAKERSLSWEIRRVLQESVERDDEPVEQAA